ncbi:MAG: aldo/keto reductase [Frankiales bacterium]|nr:aldo/keto reductase [Frankiales bacterium]
MMATRPFGTTGLDVSRIGLGAWQLGKSAAWKDGPTEREAITLVHAAIDAGVTFIDTAPGYADGQSELNLGAALRGRRDSVVLCTKFGHTPEGGSNWDAAAIRESVERSAQRLGTDHLDIVLLHSPPAEILDGTQSQHYDVLAGLAKDGLIRAFGASVDTAAEVDTVLTTSASTALEVRLSALYQEPWDALGRARDAGLGTIIKVPLESGWLAGRYGRDARFSDVRSRWSRDDVTLRAALVDEFRAMLPAGMSLLSGALRFLLANDAVSTVIPGTKSLAHLQSTLGAAGDPLPAEIVQEIRTWYAEKLAAKPLNW